MILSCSCVNTYQDEKYGKEKRVHNLCKPKNPGTDIYRCTVCGAIKNISGKTEVYQRQSKRA